jgi:two-component system chemotaxis response regulator CheB
MHVLEGADRRSPRGQRYAIVAIGASAGGVEALHVVVGSLPAGLPAAVLVVQHLDPRHKSRLAGLLGRYSALPVREAASGEEIGVGRVYVAQPDAHLIVREGRLVLTDTAPVHFSRPSVDQLFESVSHAYGDGAIAVVLSGTGVDGAAGIRAVKGAGGTTIVQDPATAAHRGMPEAARATGCVDLVLPLVDVGPAISRLVAGAAEAP